MSLNSLSPNQIQHFTATGRPFKNTSRESSYTTGMNSIMGADTFGNGNGAPNVLPFRYTDESTIMIPVLKTPFSTSSGQQEQEEGESETREGMRWSKFSLRRKSKPVGKDEFEMKSVTRGEYLERYAKDEEGRYCGSEDPAGDCILRHPEDVKVWRSGV